MMMTEGKKAKDVVLTAQYGLLVYWLLCMCECVFVVRCYCVAFYTISFFIYIGCSLACLFACRSFDGDTHFSLLHTQKHTQTHAQAKPYIHLVNTQRHPQQRLRSARTKRANTHNHIHAVKRYYTNNNNNNSNRV